MAKGISALAGLTKSFESKKTLNVPVASKSRGSAWKPGDACPFESGVYCEDIIRRNDRKLFKLNAFRSAGVYSDSPGKSPAA